MCVCVRVRGRRDTATVRLLLLRYERTSIMREILVVAPVIG